MDPPLLYRDSMLEHYSQKNYYSSTKFDRRTEERVRRNVDRSRQRNCVLEQDQYLFCCGFQYPVFELNFQVVKIGSHIVFQAGGDQRFRQAHQTGCFHFEHAG